MLPALLASAPDLDPVAALPAARALRDAAKAHDWSTVDTGFGRLVEPAAQVIALSAIGRVTKRAFIEEVFAGDPTSPLAGTLLAWRLVEDGWKIRTG
ncbi:MAG: hypothetical protein J2P15_21585, partial [Micromonosporaceae bacterium]|nr:hypothetical protein [Micromonosporaceae bacterium]